MRASTVLRRHRLALGATAAMTVLAAIAAGVPAASGGFTAGITNSTDTVGTATYFTCQGAIGADLSSAVFEWPLSDPSGSTTASDVSGNGRSGTYVGTMAADSSTPIGCPRDTGSAWRLDGSTNYAYTGTPQSGPQVFTLEAYFQTSVKAGKIIGFGNGSTAASTKYDRQLYVNSSGGVTFGVYNAGYKAIASTAVVTDGAWHHVAATLSSSGMKLYLDGVLVGTDPNTVAESNVGYWRVGYDTLAAGWPNVPASAFFSGRLRGVGVYTVELTARQVADHAAPTS